MELIMHQIKHTFVVICVSIILYQSIAIEAKAEGKSISKHHGTDPSESTLIGNAVQHKSKMHHKGSDNQSSRRADINSQGKTGFTSRSIYTTYGQPQPVTRTFRQTPSEQPSYAPITSVSEPAPSTYGVPQSAPVYTPTAPVEKEKEVIIKVLPLPIPVGTPVPSPVHIGVPSISPFVNSQYSSYNSLPVFNGVGVAPRMDETDSEPIGTRRSADADHSILGGQFGNIDSHTHTTHHHTQSSHEHPQVIVAQLPPQQVAYPTIALPSISQPQYVLVPRPESTPYANGLFGGFGGQLTPTLTNVALGNSGNTIHSSFGLDAAGLQNSGFGAFPYVPNGDNQIPNALGNDPIKASFIAARSNPLIHLLAAPYIKNIKENNGEDLPTLEDLQDLLERSSFGLSGFEDEGKK